MYKHDKLRTWRNYRGCLLTTELLKVFYTLIPANNRLLLVEIHSAVSVSTDTKQTNISTNNFEHPV